MANTQQRVHWRDLIDRALGMADNVNTATYLQLATYDADRGAQVRTLVFRGFSDNSDRLFMATDLHSQKVEQIRADNRVQIAWYLAEAREQFRFSGKLACLDSSAVEQGQRHALWNAMSPRARASFFCDALGQALEGAKELALNTTPPSNFALLALMISDVELLSIAQNPHLRRRFWLGDTGWQQERMPL